MGEWIKAFWGGGLSGWRLSGEGGIGKVHNKYIPHLLRFCTTICLSFHGPCGAHVVFIPGIRFSILNKLTFQVTWLQTRHPLHRSCDLIPEMHLTNYYKTEWINLLDVRNWRKLQHAAILSGWRFPHTNFDDSAHKFGNVWWFCTQIVQVQH